MAPVYSRVRAIGGAVLAAAALAALDTLAGVDLGFLGEWQNVGALALAAGIAWAKRETALAGYLRAAGHTNAAGLVDGSAGVEAPTPAPGAAG